MKPSYQTFIAEMLRHGDKERAYKAAYPKAQGKALTSAANRLLANPEIAAAVNETRQRIRAEAEAEVKTQVAEELLTLHCVKQLLTQIAEGQHTVEKQVRTKSGSYEIINVKPTESQVLSALRLYCRLQGWIMPVSKTAATPSPEPKQEKAPNPYVEEFRRILKETEPQQQEQLQPQCEHQPQAIPLPASVFTAPPVPAPAEPVPTQVQTIPLTGYTYLSDLIQDSWDTYIRNQNGDNWRRYQNILKLNNRNLPPTERTAVCQLLGLDCHPQDKRYYKRQQIQATNLQQNHHGRHFERS